MMQGTMTRVAAVAVATVTLALGIVAPSSSAPAQAAETTEGWIVFTRDPTPVDFEGGDEELWGIRSDGTGAVQLTSNNCASITPNASRDGLWVAWVEKCSGGMVDLFVGRTGLTPQGNFSLTQITNITSFLGGGSDRWPQFSPDDTQMAFIRKTSGNFDVWRADIVSGVGGVPSLSNPVRVVRLGDDPLVEDCCVSWSPDGQELVWASNVNKSQRMFDLYRIDSDAVEIWDARTNVDGSPDGTLDPQVAERLTNQSFYEGTPAYDSDGTVLHRCNCPNGDVYRLDPDTGVATRLTTHLELDRTPEGFPGGILYSRQNSGNDEIYIAGPSGQSPTNLTNHPYSDRDPSWVPPSTLPGPDTEVPNGTISAPPSGATVPYSSVTTTGTATDNRSVATVRIGIQRDSDGRWLQSDTTWGITPAYLGATLGTPGGTTTSWSFSFQPGVGGDHAITVLVTDASGNDDLTPATRTFAVADPGAAVSPQLTLLFSRLQMSSAVNCVPTGAPLDTVVAPELQRRGLKGTFSLVTNWTSENTRSCGGGKKFAQSIIYGSWADATNLRDAFGWQVISQSKTYPNMTTLTPAQQLDQSCGSLPAFTSHGFTRATGMFAYPNDAYSTQIQQDIVSTCFAFGRTYAGRYDDLGGAINYRSSIVAPWFQKTFSLGGGKCTDGAPICSTINQTPYVSPIALGNTIAGLQNDQWYVLQGYRFVTGSEPGRWDCTGSAWTSHWTSSIEDYCWVDYMTILDRIQPGTVVTDPLTVGEAWGRVP